MTRRDYIAIARAIMVARAEGEFDVTFQAALDEVTRTLALELAADNPRFDRERFYGAAGARIEVTDTR